MTARTGLLQISNGTWDLIVIGGGVTGAGVALGAVKNGLRTLLLERRDFAWGTSSRSSKLVHGGLRYLKEGAIHLTRESVLERDALLRGAPGLVEPMTFLWPHYRDLKGAAPLVMDAGLALYDLLGGQWRHRRLSAAQTCQLIPPIRNENLTGSHQYLDATTDDARLVLRLIEDAKALGAVTLNYVSASPWRVDGQVNGVHASDEVSGIQADLHAKLVINATGVVTDKVHGHMDAIRPLRGSHLLIRDCALPLAQAVAFFHPDDGRPVFAYPWQGRTIVGTTDLDHDAQLLDEASIQPVEVAYLLKAVQHAFPKPRINDGDIVSTWAGVRPVVGGQGGDPSKERRDHVVWQAPGLVSITGGKLTTFRRMACDALRAGAKELGLERFADTPTFSDSAPPFDTRLSASTLIRLRGHHGARLEKLLGDACDNELTAVQGQDRLIAELRWSLINEQVVHLDDLLLRRSRLGLLLPNGAISAAPLLKRLCHQTLGWDDTMWNQEWTQWQNRWRTHYSLPTTPKNDKENMELCNVA